MASVYVTFYLYFVFYRTTIPFHQALMNNDVFKSAKFNTKFLEENDVLGVATTK